MVRRNIIFLLMSLEIMLNACGLAFVAAGARWGQADGQIMFMLILTLAAAEVAVAWAWCCRSSGASRPWTWTTPTGCGVERDMMDLLWLIPALPLASA